MNPLRRPSIAVALALSLLTALTCRADDGGDPRTAVPLPPASFLHEREVMRDHLEAMARIEADLARQDWNDAAHVAQQHLGLDVMGPTQMQLMHRYMPPPMQAMGMHFHQAAANLVVQIQDAGASGDPGPALGALAEVTQACVACHAAYRFTLSAPAR